VNFELQYLKKKKHKDFHINTCVYFHIQTNNTSSYSNDGITKKKTYRFMWKSLI